MDISGDSRFIPKCITTNVFEYVEKKQDCALYHEVRCCTSKENTKCLLPSLVLDSHVRVEATHDGGGV